jgi:hypothetical protein
MVVTGTAALDYCLKRAPGVARNAMQRQLREFVQQRAALAEAATAEQLRRRQREREVVDQAVRQEAVRGGAATGLRYPPSLLVHNVNAVLP